MAATNRPAARYLRLTHRLLPALLLVGTFAAACGPLAAPAGPPPGDAVTAAPEAPKRGGVLHIPNRRPLDTLDPFFSGGGSSRALGEPRYEPLVVFKQGPDLDPRIDFELQPWLAERWEQQNDTTYAFHLRKGVKWHDGEEFTADDVVSTIQWVNDPQHRYRARALTSEIASTEPLDRLTVRIQLKRKNVGFLGELREFFMLPRHVMNKGDSFDKVSVGTGPFRLASFDKLSGFALERDPSYWDSPRPHLDGVVGHYGLDDSGMLAAFAAGQTDLLTTELQGLEVVKQSVPDVQVNKFIGDHGASLYLRLDKPPYNDVRVRKALHLALDRHAMVQTITSGEGAINPPGITGHKRGYAIPPEELFKLPGYDPAAKQKDVQEAKRLLAEAGYAGGFKESVIFSKGATSHPPIAEMAASQLKLALGVDLTLQPLDAGVMAQRDTRGEFTMQVSTLHRMDLDLTERFRSGSPLNTAGINDPELDRLIDAIAATADASQKRKLARDIQMLLLDKVYILPTIELASFPLAHAWVRNYSFGWGQPHAVPYWFGSDIWLDLARMPAGRRSETPRLSGR